MIIHDEAEARSFCSGLGDAAGLERLARLETLLKVENRVQNLIAKTSESSIWLRHFADSAQLLGHVSRETGTWLDLGTGAGFPGLVIAALRPATRVVLVESRRRRADWLGRAVEALGLEECIVESRRLESVPDLKASVISARAFAPLPKLLRLSARFSTHDTVWLLPKGRSAGQEVASLDGDAPKMFHVEPSVTDREAGILVGRGQPRIA